MTTDRRIPATPITRTVFHERDRHASTPAHEIALDSLEAGITAARPKRVVAETVEVDGDALWVLDDAHDLSAFDEILVLGGKAAKDVAFTREMLDGWIDDGVVVTTDVDPERGRDDETATIDVRDGDHPTPTERNVEATADLLDLADTAAEATGAIVDQKERRRRSRRRASGTENDAGTYLEGRGTPSDGLHGGERE